MSHLPRLAVGSVQSGVDPRPILWALIEVLRREGLQVQTFLSRATFSGYRETATVTGLNPHHLDSWLMSAETCREVLVRGSRAADIAVVHGKFSTALDAAEAAGGTLETLCEWLDLPRLAVVDVSSWGPCALPPCPDRADALLLDRVPEGDGLGRLATNLETLWGIPVLGALPAAPHVRSALAGIPHGSGPPRELFRELGRRFILHGRRDALRDLAAGRAFSLPVSGSSAVSAGPAATRRDHRARSGAVTVAMAYDEAFDCYFPDVLELLELGGAKVVDFSPLKDESLPEGSDVVYLGCGHPERYAAALADNHCMKLALRSHLRRGRRIYSEGGGTAYLCQRIETPQGDFQRMVGIIPAQARLTRTPRPPQPVEATLCRPSWLGSPGSRVRGYRNSHWHLEPAGPLVSLLAEKECRGDLVGSFHAVASRLHLNFAALPGLLERFLRPHHGCPAVPDPWTAVQ